MIGDGMNFYKNIETNEYMECWNYKPKSTEWVEITNEEEKQKAIEYLNPKEVIHDEDNSI